MSPHTRKLVPSNPAAILCVICALGVETLPAENIDDFTWPQEFDSDAFDIAIYEPQIHEWQDMKHVVARAAVGMKSRTTLRTIYGALTIEADTVADFEERVVYFGERKFPEIRFPEARDDAEAKNLEQVVRSILTPTRPLTMSLDSMIANVDRTAIQTREVKANFAPPPIFYSDEPALLVIFLGEPKFEMVDGVDGVLFAVNTNWDVLFHLKSSTYYLLGGDFWLRTDDVMKGKWSRVDKLPEEFRKLPTDENFGEILANLDGPPAQTVPKLFVVNRPAELILTSGKRELSPVSGTALLRVANTDADIFYLASDRKYYFLTSGRWFSASGLEGPWEAATEDLPGEFAKLPEDEENAHILTSVPGTAAAEEAVIAASIPKTATVNRSEATVKIAYDGDPRFIPVPGTDIQFAINSPNDVFLVSGKYYSCYQGVWFVAATPNGKWIVCDSVPTQIYSIPPEHPKHNVTYCYVYSSTPSTVEVGTTSGYDGGVIAGGLLMFGLGYWLADNNNWWEDDYWRWYYRYPPPACYYGYGSGAYYRWSSSRYYAAGYRYYGPYGGAGGGAAYNPYTGTYARGGYRYGPYGGFAAGGVYNPYTGAYARGAYRTTGYSSMGARAGYNPWANTYAAQARVNTPYGTWGRSAVVRDDEWMRTGHRSNWKGTVSGAQTSRGGEAVRVNRNYGSDGFVGQTGSGDVYVGRDGNVYRKDPDGGWQSRNDGAWEKAGVPSNTTRNWVPENRTGSGNRPNAESPPNRGNTADLQKRTQDISQRRSQVSPSRPSTPSVSRPSTPVVSRPATPSYRPPTSYTPRTTTSQQLNWDSRSRQRSSYSSSTSSRSRSSSSSYSRSGGGRSRGGGGRRR